MAAVVKRVSHCLTVSGNRYLNRATQCPGISQQISFNLGRFGCRTFVSPRLIGVEKFDYMCKEAQARYSQFATEFKNKLMESLDDDGNTVYFEDAQNFFKLAESSDAPNFLRLLERWDSQQADADHLGLEGKMRDYDMVPSALRKLHLLNLPSEALNFYRNLDSVKKTWYHALIVMDLLYENDMYTEITDLAVEVMEMSEPSSLEFYTVAITAAYKQASSKGLKTAYRFYDHMIANDQLKNVTSFTPENLKTADMRGRDIRCLLALYCIQQGFPNAALRMLHSNDRSYTWSSLERNAKALALMKLNQTHTASKIVSGLLDRSRLINDQRKQAGLKRRHLIYHDLGEEILSYLEKEDDGSKVPNSLRVVARNQSSLVNMFSLSKKIITLFNKREETPAGGELLSRTIGLEPSRPQLDGQVDEQPVVTV